MKRVIEFTKIRFFMIALSVIVLATGIGVTIAQGGFNLGIDFQAGLTQRVQITASGGGELDVEDVRDALSELPSAQAQRVGQPGSNEFSVEVRDDGTTENFVQVMSNRIVSLLEAEFGSGSVEQLSNSFVGPRFSQTLARQALVLVGLAMGLILLYIWFRFRLGYALAAIAALVHDMTFMLGFIGAFQLEVSTATIAAVLTVIGYSLNDTIVVFDRIRENETILRESDFESIINTSITQSLSRTVITSVTTLLAVLSIYTFATGTIQTFALKLAVGIVVGTYSSIFIASPILLGWRRQARKRQRRKELEKYGQTALNEPRKGGEKAPAASRKPAAAAAAASGGETAPAASGGGPGGGQQRNAPDAEEIRKQLGKKKQPSGGKNVPRSKRKKKK
jgi:preprotein translocase subunit SecF